MLRAIIIDDEPGGINALVTMIEKYTTGLKVVSKSTDPEEGIALIEDLKPDVVFLDVNMPLMDGFDLLAKLRYKDFKLVFTTAYQEYAIKAIKNKAHDYLLKPIGIEELKLCINSIAWEVSKTNNMPNPFLNHFIELPVKDGIIFIKPHDIIRLEASGSYTVFYLVNNVKHIASRNLKQCESMLHWPYFFRSHPSHIINLEKVNKMVMKDGLFVQMCDDSMPEMSRKNKELFLEKLKTI
jgi:two-component system, LytTR family, response regulator